LSVESFNLSRDEETELPLRSLPIRFGIGDIDVGDVGDIESCLSNDSEDSLDFESFVVTEGDFEDFEVDEFFLE
jgi:hypothetical protein